MPLGTTPQMCAEHMGMHPMVLGCRADGRAAQGPGPTEAPALHPLGALASDDQGGQAAGLGYQHPKPGLAAPPCPSSQPSSTQSFDKPQ